jgi:diguanylate cyclase (GGDEF)-like protein
MGSPIRAIARHIWPGSLQFHIFIIVLLAILPVAALQFRSFSQEQERIIARTNDDAVRIAQQAVSHAVDAVHEARSSLQLLSEVPAMRYATDASCSMQMSRVVNSRPWATGLFALDPAGTVVCASDPQTMGISIADRSYVKTALERRSFFAGDFIIGRKSKIPMIGSALPVYGSDGELIRIFVATIATKWFDKIASELVQANPGSTVTLVDGNHVVLADAPAGGDEIGKPLTSAQMRAALNGPERKNFSAIGDDGTERLFGTATLAHSNARIVVGLSRTVVLADLAAKRQSSLLELAALMLVLGAAVWALCAHAIARPINILLQHATKIGQGRLNSRIAIRHWPRELAALGRSSNIMAARINRRNTQLHKAHRALKKQSLTDHLTGLPNRRCFDAMVDDAWQTAATTGTELSVCMVDADHFKLFNDTYGHGAGDQALRAIGDILGRIASRHGGVAARLGGEEFALLLAGAGEERALQIADEVCEGVAARQMVHAHSTNGFVSVSVGAACAIPATGCQITTVFAAADAALYAAKAFGRNRAIGASRLGTLSVRREKADTDQRGRAA